MPPPITPPSTGHRMLRIIGITTVVVIGLPVLVIAFIFFKFGQASRDLTAQYNQQYQTLETSLPAPTMVADYKCAGSSGDLEWQIWSVNAVSPGNSNLEVQEPPSVYASPEFRLIYNGQKLWTTGPTQRIMIPGVVATTSFPISQSTVIALTSIGNLITAATPNVQSSVDLVRSCLVSHASDVAPLIQFYNWGNQISLKFRTSASAASLSGTKVNFPATIPIPGPGSRTPVFLTLLPGQSATGTLGGVQARFTVDPETAPDVMPAYHIYVNDQEDTAQYVGNVMVQVATQYGDGSVQWDIFYQ